MRLRTIAVSIVSGIVGFLLMMSLWHLWLDHQQFHVLIGWANSEIAKGSAK